MTEEQINITIALSVGWISIGPYICNPPKRNAWIHPDLEGKEFPYPPPYATSLDACAEFENAIPKNDFEAFNEYIEHLCDILEREDPEETHLRLISAKAPQRCEAYLRTIGKWTPSNQQPT